MPASRNTTPNVISRTGLEDLETLECVFSVSNQLVNVAWYASAFQHQLFIDNFFCQWDEDKYQNLGVMLYNNYKQALDIINTDFIALQEAMNFLNIQEEDFAWWQNKEIEYVSQLSTESEENLLHITYVEMLQKLHNNDHLTHAPTAPSSCRPRKLETEQHHACELHEGTLRERQCKAIQTALSKYNKAASELNSPRPELDWSEVLHYGSLEEFTLLCETRQDVLSKPQHIHALQGFTGDLTFGQWKGARLPPSTSTVGVHSLQDDEVDGVDVEGSDSSDDEGDQDMDVLNLDLQSHLTTGVYWSIVTSSHMSTINFQHLTSSCLYMAFYFVLGRGQSCELHLMCEEFGPLMLTVLID
ncbi:hypothetical protein IMY05_C1152000900 [Salix suchowensis]|nr:hypothetical protein IMY05_C1152000900 [Salix suchowensis]